MTIYATRGSLAGLQPRDISLVDDDLYAVLDSIDPIGFVHKAGNVFVSLSGTDTSRAVEVGQSLSWDVAVAMVRGAHRAQREFVGAA
jgi:hypothetical protein